MSLFRAVPSFSLNGKSNSPSGRQKETFTFIGNSEILNLPPTHRSSLLLAGALSDAHPANHRGRRCSARIDLRSFSRPGTLGKRRLARGNRNFFWGGNKGNLVPSAKRFIPTTTRKRRSPPRLTAPAVLNHGGQRRRGRSVQN